MPSRISKPLRHQSRFADPTPSRRASRVDVRRDEGGDVIEEVEAEQDGMDEDIDDPQDDDNSSHVDGRERGEVGPSRSSRRQQRGAGEERRAGATATTTMATSSSHREGRGGGGGCDSSTIQDPPAQPLNSDSIVLLRGNHRAWDDAVNRLDNIKAFYRDTSATYAECNDEDEAEEKLNELDAEYRELIDMTVEAQMRKSVLDDLIKSIARGEEITNAKERYETKVTEQLQTYQRKTSRQKYLDASTYKEYKETVWDAWKEEAMPPMTDFIAAENGDQEDQEDFAIGGVRMEYKCPLTMALLEEPVTSKTCRHSYSKAAILEYIANARRQDEAARCPRSGCDKVLNESVLKDDKELEKKVKTFTRRMEMRTESRRTQATQILD